MLELPMSPPAVREDSSSLRQEMDRIRSADPFTVYRLTPLADVVDVRNAFLAATKRFHPNRFATASPEARDLANEVFLVYRRAYDQLTDDAKRKQWQDRLRPAAPLGARPSIHTPAHGTPAI